MLSIDDTSAKLGGLESKASVTYSTDRVDGRNNLSSLDSSSSSSSSWTLSYKNIVLCFIYPLLSLFYLGL